MSEELIPIPSIKSQEIIDAAWKALSMLNSIEETIAEMAKRIMSLEEENADLCQALEAKETEKDKQ